MKLIVWVEPELGTAGKHFSSPHTDLRIVEERIGDASRNMSMAREAIIALRNRAEAGLAGGLRPNQDDDPDSVLDSDNKTFVPSKIGRPGVVQYPKDGPRDFEG